METDASPLGWGAVCNGIRTGGLWTQSERRLHINCLELMGGAFAVKAFTQHKTQVKVLLLMGNVTAVTYINKMGGTRSPILSGLAFELWSWCLQCQNSLMARHIPGIQNLQADQESRTVVDHSDWKLKPEIFQCIQRLWGPLEIDLFASRLSYQIPRYASWRPDPGAETVDVFTLDWAQLTGYAFPPFALVGRCLKQVILQQVQKLVIVAPVWETQPWYPLLLQLCVDFSRLLPQPVDLLTRQGENHPPNPPSVSRMTCLNRSYSETGISAEARTLLMAAWRKNTSSAYGAAWQKWASWCNQQQVNPLSAPLSAVLDFLTREFNWGKAYRSINVYRSAISMTHPTIDSLRVGEHPLVCQLMKGIFNKRPPLPRYTQTWKVHQVTNYLEGLGDNSELSLKQLSGKLVVLLALTSAERGSELAAHDLRFRRFYPEGVSFTLPQLTKT